MQLNTKILESEHLLKTKNDEYKWIKIEKIPKICMAYKGMQLSLKKKKK